MRPLTVSEVATVKQRFSSFSAYMTMDECMEILDLPDDRHYPATVFGKKPAIGISMTLHDDSLLFIRCDQRGYVVQAQLDDEKWEWTWDPGKADQ